MGLPQLLTVTSSVSSGNLLTSLTQFPHSGNGIYFIRLLEMKRINTCKACLEQYLLLGSISVFINMIVKKQAFCR